MVMLGMSDVSDRFGCVRFRNTNPIQVFIEASLFA